MYNMVYKLSAVAFLKVIAILKVIAVYANSAFLFLWRQQTNVAYLLDGGRFFGRQIKMTTSTITPIGITVPPYIPMIAGLERTEEKEEIIYIILD